jgi:regulator of RNase E activity RraA
VPTNSEAGIVGAEQPTSRRQAGNVWRGGVEGRMKNSGVIDEAALERLRQASTATIATQLFKLGLRTRFLTGLAPLNPERCRFVGEAATLRYIPMREDLDHPDVYGDLEHPQRKAIETARPGAVLVIDCRGDIRAGSVGAILAARLRARGAAGLVTGGAVRDAGEIAAGGLPVFAAARSAAVSLSVHHAADFDVPIACAGVAVFPGDVLVGDEDGVVVIPRHLAAQIATPAAEQEALERFLLAKVEAGAPLPGTYPPNAQTLAEYETQRRSLEMD